LVGLDSIHIEVGGCYRFTSWSSLLQNSRGFG
jgi:hypothetical protein